MSNWHVVFVHFPIALLSAYAILEILRIPRLQNFLHHFHVKAFLVIIGTGGGVLAGLTGKLIEEQLSENIADRRILELHSGMAQLSTAFFGFFAFLYLLAWLGRENFFVRLPQVNPLLNLIEKFLASRIMILFGIIGLGMITLTGTLGGMLVYGPNVDPLARVVYNLLQLGQ